MDHESDEWASGGLPDEAFAALGHRLRLEILVVLATTDRARRPLSFSELREAVDGVGSAKFNYHLGELVSHFVERSEAGYDLRRAGGRIAEAILSGGVPGETRMDRTRVDRTCHLCGSPVEVTYREERVETYCTSCAGVYGTSNTQEADGSVPAEYGFLGNLHLPPVGLAERTPDEAYDAAHTWSLNERLLAATGTCPRCSATLDETVRVCEDHEYDGCADCTNRYAILHEATCTTCPFGQRAAFALALLDDTALQSFLASHDINLVAPDQRTYAETVMDYDETVRRRDPFAAEFTFTADGDAITLRVDDAFQVVDVTRSE